jgi:hypothetical protein
MKWTLWYCEMCFISMKNISIFYRVKASERRAIHYHRVKNYRHLIKDDYPLVNVYIAMENGHRKWLIYPLKMVMFHSYVCLPEGKGKATGKPHICWENPRFSLDFPKNTKPLTEGSHIDSRLPRVASGSAEGSRGQWIGGMDCNRLRIGSMVDMYIYIYIYLCIYI